MIKTCMTKGNALILCNFLRHYAMTSVKVLRPIGFKVGSYSSLLSSTDNCIDDMLTFYGRLASLHYTYTEDKADSLVVVTLKCGSILHSSDLSAKGVRANRNIELLHFLANGNSGAQGEEVTIYFRNAVGNHTADDNEHFLTSRGHNVSESQITVYPSRHCIINKMNFSIDDTLVDKDIVSIEIETDSNFSVNELLKLAVSSAVTELNSLKFE